MLVIPRIQKPCDGPKQRRGAMMFPKVKCFMINLNGNSQEALIREELSFNQIISVRASN